MLAAKAPHPQAVYRVDMPAAHTVQLARLSYVVDKINATEKFPAMRATQVGSWPWRNYLKQYMRSKGLAISDALLIILDSGDWDLRIEPANDTVTVPTPQLVAYVQALLHELGIIHEVPFQYYFNMKWELADLSIQACQIKPINNFDTNLDKEGRILFDDSLNETIGTHQYQFMRFIENSEIITHHIFGILETFKKSIEQKKQLTQIEESKIYFMMKTYIKPLKIPGAHFHLNTSQAWCDFMMMPETKTLYRQLSEKVIKRYKCNDQDYQLFEMAVKHAYIKDTMPRLHEMVSELSHHLNLYKAIKTYDFEGVDLSSISDFLASPKTIEQVYDIELKVKEAAKLVSAGLSALKGKSRATAALLKEEDLMPLEPIAVYTPPKIVKNVSSHALIDTKELDEDNVPVNKLIHSCIEFIQKNHQTIHINHDFTHLYQSLWENLFLEYGVAYQKLTGRQRAIFFSAFVTQLLKHEIFGKKNASVAEVLISYLLNTHPNMPQPLFEDSVARANYVTAFYAWFSLTKPFSVSDVNEIMKDFIHSHEYRYSKRVCELLLADYNGMIEASQLLMKHKFVSAGSMTSKPLVQSKSLPINSRILSYFYTNNEITLGPCVAINYHAYICKMIRAEIMHFQASSNNMSNDTSVIAGESFIRGILYHATHAINLAKDLSCKHVLNEFIVHFDEMKPVYRVFYRRMYDEYAQIQESLMPLLLQEILVAEKEIGDLGKIFKMALLKYMKIYPNHEPTMHDINEYSLPGIYSLIELINMLFSWDHNNPALQRKLYSHFMKKEENRKNIEPTKALMRQMLNIQDKESIKNFDNKCQCFASFIQYHHRDEQCEKLRFSNSSKLS